MHISKTCIVLLTLVSFAAAAPLSDDELVYHLAANNRPDLLLFAFKKSYLRREQSEDSRFKIQTIAADTGKLQEIALSPDGNTLAYSTWRDVAPQSVNGVGYLVLSETESGRILWKIPAHKANAFRLAFSPDCKQLATGSWDMHARIWDVATGKLLWDLAGHTHSVYDVEFSPDGESLVTGSADGTVRLWDCSSGVTLMSYTPVEFDASSLTNPDVYDVAFTPDGKKIVSTHFNKTLCLWNIDEQKIEGLYELPFQAKKIVVSREGRHVACFDGQSVFVWNLETGKPDPILGKRFQYRIEDIASASPASRYDLIILDTNEKFWFCNMSPRKIE